MKGLRTGVLTVFIGGVFAAVALAAPINTGAPKISGKAVYLQTLKCNPGAWTGATRYGYSWQVGGAPAANGQTFRVPLLAVGGYQVTCTVTAYDAGGASASATSNAVIPTTATPTVKITKASAKKGTITISGTISPKQAVSGNATVVLDRVLGHDSYLQLTFGGALHHKTRFTLKAKDSAKGHPTYGVELNPGTPGFAPQVIVKKKLTVR